jgi:hypothetical protein
MKLRILVKGSGIILKNKTADANRMTILWCNLITSVWFHRKILYYIGNVQCFTLVIANAKNTNTLPRVLMSFYT